MGISKMMDLLADSREIIRNDVRLSVRLLRIFILQLFVFIISVVSIRNFCQKFFMTNFVALVNLKKNILLFEVQP